ncbi:MAG: flagellar protein FliS, partial [Phycisphaerales bacterium]
MARPTPNSYLRNAVMTATPEQLHLMLYDGAIRFTLQARDAIEARDYEGS